MLSYSEHIIETSFVPNFNPFKKKHKIFRDVWTTFKQYPDK